MFTPHAANCIQAIQVIIAWAEVSIAMGRRLWAEASMGRGLRYSTNPHILTKPIFFLNPWDVLNMKWCCSIENIGMQYLFWLYLYRFPYADHIYNF